MSDSRMISLINTIPFRTIDHNFMCEFEREPAGGGPFPSSPSARSHVNHPPRLTYVPKNNDDQLSVIRTARLPCGIKRSCSVPSETRAARKFSRSAYKPSEYFSRGIREVLPTNTSTTQPVENSNRSGHGALGSKLMHPAQDGMECPL